MPVLPFHDPYKTIPLIRQIHFLLQLFGRHEHLEIQITHISQLLRLLLRRRIRESHVQPRIIRNRIVIIHVLHLDLRLKPQILLKPLQIRIYHIRHPDIIIPIQEIDIRGNRHSSFQLTHDLLTVRCQGIPFRLRRIIIAHHHGTRRHESQQHRNHHHAKIFSPNHGKRNPLSRGLQFQNTQQQEHGNHDHEIQNIFTTQQTADHLVRTPGKT